MAALAFGAALPTTADAGIKKSTATKKDAGKIKAKRKVKTERRRRVRKHQSPLTGRRLFRRKIVRDFGELHVVWRAVEMVERGNSHVRPILKEHGQSGRGAQTPAGQRNEVYATEIAPDLKNFVRFGRSSLTPYEASRLSEGFGVEGQQRFGDIEAQRKFLRGDRVLISVREPGRLRGKRTRGIMLNGGGILAVDGNNQFRIYYPELHNGKEGRQHVKIVKMVTPALRDGRLQQFAR